MADLPEITRLLQAQDLGLWRCLQEGGGEGDVASERGDGLPTPRGSRKGWTSAFLHHDLSSQGLAQCFHFTSAQLSTLVAFLSSEYLLVS
jgi:hypothetical protein